MSHSMPTRCVHATFASARVAPALTLSERRCVCAHVGRRVRLEQPDAVGRVDEEVEAKQLKRVLAVLDDVARRAQSDADGAPHLRIDVLGGGTAGGGSQLALGAQVLHERLHGLAETLRAEHAAEARRDVLLAL